MSRLERNVVYSTSSKRVNGSLYFFILTGRLNWTKKSRKWSAPRKRRAEDLRVQTAMRVAMTATTMGNLQADWVRAQVQLWLDPVLEEAECLTRNSMCKFVTANTGSHECQGKRFRYGGIMSYPGNHPIQTLNDSWWERPKRNATWKIWLRGSFLCVMTCVVGESSVLSRLKSFQSRIWRLAR